jgi:hypothetical protein
MWTGTMLKRSVVVFLCVLLVSCGAARPALSAPTSAANLSRFVLILQEHPDGQVTHSWRPVEGFDLTPYRNRDDSSSGAVVPAAAQPRDCDEENRECYRKCMDRPLPRGYGGFTSPRKRGGKSEFCRGECQQAYEDCLELERLRPQEFRAMDGAVDWLKRHRTTVLVGSVIVISGVAFVVLSAAAGAVVLAPVVLMTSAEVPVMEGAR